jgi:hypothetical protein
MTPDDGADLCQSMALGCAAESIAVNFPHPTVRCVFVYGS